MGRGGPIAWAPYSPDLTLCDYYLWGAIKERVYRRGLPRTTEELGNRIAEEFARLDPAEIDRAADAYVERLRRCVEVGGKSVEQGYGQNN